MTHFFEHSRVLFIFFAIFFSRPITTFVHELGHAIPSLLFTSGDVVIHIGSYGDTSNSYQWQLGRLKIVFKFKLTDWQLGLCSHRAVGVIWKELLIILGGPVFSLLLGLFFLWLISFYKEDQYIAFAIGIFLTAGFLDFIANIIPSKDALEMHDGRLTYNDGAQFLRVLKSSRYPEAYFEGIQLMSEGKTEESIVKFKEVIDGGVRDIELYRLVMGAGHYSRGATEGFSGAESERGIAPTAFFEEYGGLFTLSSNDFLEIGILYEEKDLSLKAINQYGKAIEKNYLNKKALARRGKLFLELGYMERGKADVLRANS